MANSVAAPEDERGWEDQMTHIPRRQKRKGGFGREGRDAEDHDEATSGKRKGKDREGLTKDRTMKKAHDAPSRRTKTKEGICCRLPERNKEGLFKPSTKSNKSTHRKDEGSSHRAQNKKQTNLSGKEALEVFHGQTGEERRTPDGKREEFANRNQKGKKGCLDPYEPPGAKRETGQEKCALSRERCKQ